MAVGYTLGLRHLSAKLTAVRRLVGGCAIADRDAVHLDRRQVSGDLADVQARIGRRRPESRGHPGRLVARNGTLADRLGPEWSAAKRRSSRSDQPATGPTLLTCSLGAASGGRP
jgi:hypothetical protein